MQPNQQLTMNDGTVLDPKVLKVVRTLRQIESGGDYNAVGDGGDARGAFQYNEKTGPGWKNIARQYLGDENAPMDRANQNKATYLRVKEWKDKQFQPEEIAALWNGATKGPDGRYTCVNPEYCKKFRETLMGQQQMGGQAAPIGNTQFQTTTQAPTQTAPQGGFLSQLNTLPMEAPKPPSQVDVRLGQAGDAFKTFSQGVTSGNPLQMGSGVLQAGGAAAGGFLDATDAVIKAIPIVGDVVEGAEKVVGAAAGKALDTDLGQKAVAGYEKLPESWQKNLGAAGNIAAAVPVLRGLKMAAGGIKNKVTDVVKGTPDDLAKKELEQVVTRVIPGGRSLQKAQRRGLDPIGIILKEAPLTLKKDAQGLDRYDGTQSYKTLEETISQLDDQLDAVLAEATRKVPGYAGFWDLVDVKEEIAREIKKEFRGNPQIKSALKMVESDIEGVIESFGGGSRIDFNDLNLVKRKVRKPVDFNDPDKTLKSEIGEIEGRVIMRLIEEAAAKRGLENVKELNQAMSERINAQEILQKYIDNKSVVKAPGIQGLIGRQGDLAATAAGEAAGQAVGMPVLGGLAGRAIFDKATRGPVSNLERLNRGRKPTSKKDLLLPPAALVANQSGQEEQRRKQQQ